MIKAANGWYSTTVTAVTAAAWYDVEVATDTGTLLTTDGRLKLPGDIAGTYLVDDPAALSAPVDVDAIVIAVVEGLAAADGNPLTVDTPPVDAGRQVAYKATTWVKTFLNLPPHANWSRVWLSIKEEEEDSDAVALVRLCVSRATEDQDDDGLQVLNGKAPLESETGSLTVSQTTTTLTIAMQLSAAASARLPVGEWFYDVKVQDNDGAITPVVEPNTFEIRPMITRAVA